MIIYGRSSFILSTVCESGSLVIGCKPSKITKALKNNMHKYAANLKGETT